MKRPLAFLGLIIIGLSVGALTLLNFNWASENVVPVANLEVCGLRQSNTDGKTCIVDGDTLWLNGVNIRLKSFDTPESHTNICGSFTEIDLAYAATDRLQELLNGNTWTIETFGMDGTGERLLATIKIAGEDVGEILIRERLARRWPDGDEFWCS